MKTDVEDHQKTWDSQTPPQEPGADLPGAQEEAASAGPADPDYEMLEEPGYGHGV